MGSCISTCRPKTTDDKEENLVQDKLVISQALAAAPSTSPPKKQLLSPSDSPSSSSFSCTTSCNSSSCSSLTTQSSCPSSILVSKDRSFSNEFLRSIIKENPHIVLVDQRKVSALATLPAKFPSPRLESQPKLAATPSKRSNKPAVVSPAPQKRSHASSPTVTRQKSFRREPEGPLPASSTPSRTLGSPSPSRRFNKETCKTISTNYGMEERCRRPVGLKTNAGDHVSVNSRKENLRPLSPSRNPIQLKKTETRTHHISPKDDQNAVGDVLSTQETNLQPIEDIDNPLISLDCFIFL